ncbi:hypothetical protein DFH07DRAFT_319141 [Mycena maculata]|uniref:AAA-ATPase-like domain-containing protein n=1 Tax=Mycena maculata TaxID=230809 RepID=A0AAD7KBA6_9AGAR|nr:hypothetical protein DFH07DRAFT_319141 [Mycena maculata]
MASSTEPPEHVIQFLFLDKHHRPDFRPRTISIPAPKFMCMRVYEFFLMVETQHRAECKQGRCVLCQGGMLIKCAWRVNMQVATAEQITRGIELEHDAAKGIELMIPHWTMWQYLKSTGDPYRIDVLFECTFDKTDQWETDLPSMVPAKRTRSLSEDAAAGSAENIPIRQPDGLRADDTPIDLPDPSFTFPFPSHIDSTKLAVVDKTKFIPALDDLLGQHRGCMIISPKGTGKSVLASMLRTWYDCKSTGTEANRNFQCLKIATIVAHRKKEKTLPKLMWSGRCCLCLSFDLAKVEKATGGDRVARSIDRYICQTIQAFVLEYHKQLGGVIMFSPEQSESPAGMLKIIARHLKNPLFICVDHWDDPYLAALGPNDGAATDIATNLTSFLECLNALRLSKKAPVKLLILGNIPVFQDPGVAWIKNITLHHSMDGVLGMNFQELDNFFLVVSRGRRVQLSTQGLYRTLGRFSPPYIIPGDCPPPDVYTFTLVLHYVANTLDLQSGHRTPPYSPLFGKISELCVDLLEHSSLRRGRTVLVAPFSHITSVSLTTFVKHEDALWKLLFYLGALRVTNPGERDPDPMWTMEISSAFAHKQLFSPYTTMPNNVHESKREAQLRSLLERNPGPMMDAITYRLEFTALMDLQEMPEAGFQAMFNGYMADEEQTPKSEVQARTKQNLRPVWGDVGTWTSLCVACALDVWSPSS